MGKNKLNYRVEVIYNFLYMDVVLNYICKLLKNNNFKSNFLFNMKLKSFRVIVLVC